MDEPHAVGAKLSYYIFDVREAQDAEAIADYAIYMLDPEGFVTSWNSGAERIKGYGPQEILGQHFSCFYCDQDLREGRPALALREAGIGIMSAYLPHRISLMGVHSMIDCYSYLAMKYCPKSSKTFKKTSVESIDVILVPLWGNYCDCLVKDAGNATFKYCQPSVKAWIPQHGPMNVKGERPLGPSNPF